jgi:hypothetical protein
VNVKQGLLEKHLEGRYYMSHNGGWIDAGTDALEAQRKRKQLLALKVNTTGSAAKRLRRTRSFTRQRRQDHTGSSCRKIFCQLRSPRS